ncbi:hypothetical protein WH47_11089 [Habropoda laboriosa]|uniref:Mutator-like transposase domain-containing protein n=1 Tax=Habropoda laboriosa TaxID=597456 RepID=A0A0L7QM86_9HYME|nr:hypothetical protein WH47_11089 [Habropoda laboriosa]
MDKKGSKKTHAHAEHRKRRAFRGNQHTVEQSTEFVSTSAKKLEGSEDIDFAISKEFSYCILNFFTVFSTISACVICKNCKRDVKFYQTTSRGLGFKILMKCSCNEVPVNSSPFIQNAYEINRRIVFVMRLLGVGREGLNLFCRLMDIGQVRFLLGTPTYQAASVIYDCILKRAASDEMQLNKEAGNIINYLTVSGNGTWKKRRFSSLFGVSTLIGKYSKKVLDTVVKSSFCQG